MASVDQRLKDLSAARPGLLDRSRNLARAGAGRGDQIQRVAGSVSISAVRLQ